MKSVALILSVVLAGCAAPPARQDLTEPTRSISMPDVANLLAPRDIPFELHEKAEVSVAYNLMFMEGGAAQGLRLTLFLRNTSTEVKTFTPIVSLSDRIGLMIPATTYDGFVRDAAMLAGTPVPPGPALKPSQPMAYSTSGTIRSTTTGETYQYDSKTVGSTRTPFSDGVDAYARGLAIRRVREAGDARDTGRQMLRWADAFWLRQSYTVEPGKAVSGALHFPAVSPGQLPLVLSVEVGGQKFTFNTRSDPK
jgi:hypothetical protein